MSNPNLPISAGAKPMTNGHGQPIMIEIYARLVQAAWSAGSAARNFGLGHAEGGSRGDHRALGRRKEHLLTGCLNGLEQFQSGAVRVGPHQLPVGQRDRRQEAHLQLVRRMVGMVFQQFNLFPHLTVLQNVVEAPVRVLRLSRDEAVERGIALLKRVGLGEKLHQRPDRLSGGQQQRVAIARALAMQPGAMLFDEPTSALDPRMTAEVLAVLADLAASGQTMVVATHAMNFARRVAHQVHVFQNGLVLESGPPAQIFEHPQQPATAEFLGEIS